MAFCVCRCDSQIVVCFGVNESNAKKKKNVYNQTTHFGIQFIYRLSTQPACVCVCVRRVVINTTINTLVTFNECCPSHGCCVIVEKSVNEID